MSAETPSVTVSRDDERLSTLVEAGDDGELAALVAVDRDTPIAEIVSLLEEVERELGHLVELDVDQEESEDDDRERLRTDGGSPGHGQDIVRLQREAARENGNLPDDLRADGAGDSDGVELDEHGQLSSSDGYPGTSAADAGDAFPRCGQPVDGDALCGEGE